MLWTKNLSHVGLDFANSSRQLKIRNNFSFKIFINTKRLIVGSLAYLTNGINFTQNLLSTKCLPLRLCRICHRMIFGAWSEPPNDTCILYMYIFSVVFSVAFLFILLMFYQFHGEFKMNINCLIIKCNKNDNFRQKCHHMTTHLITT